MQVEEFGLKIEGQATLGIKYVLAYAGFPPPES